MFRGILILLVTALISAPTALSFDDQGGGGIIDEQGRKQGNWVYFGKDRPEEGYPAEGKIEEGPYLDDRKEGLWIKYHNDGVTPRLKGTYKSNRPNGPYERINPDGSTREKGTFNRGKHSGKLERYHPNGQLEYSANFNESGKEEGIVKYWYANGQEEFVYEAVSGIPTGGATRYHENGDVKENIVYNSDGSVKTSEELEMVNPAVEIIDQGSKEKAPKIGDPRTKGAQFKPNDYNKVYNTNDEIWQDGNFRNGRLWDGKVYEYDSDGILLKVKVFKSGVYHSDGQL